MNYFEEPYIPPSKEELCVEQHIFLEENIEVFEEVHEDLTIEEESKIKNLKEINEDPIMEKDFKFEIVETIKEEIIDEVVNDLDEVKLDDCNIQASIILVVDTETKFIDFIGVERFDLINDSHLVNIVNCMKIKEQEVQVAQLRTFNFGKKTKKMKYSKYLFSWHGRFQISKMNSRTSLFQVEGSNVEQNLQFNFCNYLILIFLCKKHYFRFR